MFQLMIGFNTDFTSSELLKTLVMSFIHSFIHFLVFLALGYLRGSQVQTPQMIFYC